MSNDDVWDAIDNQMPEAGVIDYIKTHGITFHPDGR